MPQSKGNPPLAWYGSWHDYSDPEPAPEPDLEGPGYRPEGKPQPTPWERPERGLVLGRFDPPHRGHEHLIRVAQASCKHLTVAVRAWPEESVPVKQRLPWVKELCPRARVISLPLTDDPAGWSEAVEAGVGPVHCLFASQSEAAELARQLGADFVCLDAEREAVPIRSTQIRSRPFTHWRFLPGAVRAHYARRVVLVGAEGSGKTTLARSLAERYQTCWVPEQARALAERKQGRLTSHDLVQAAGLQAASEDALARQCNRVLICDTDLMSLGQWHERLFGYRIEALETPARRRTYTLHLVCEKATTPEQQRFLMVLLGRLKAQGRAFCRLGVTEEAALPRAVEAIETLLLEPRIDPVGPGAD